MTKPFLIQDTLRQDLPLLLSIIKKLPTAGLAKGAARLLMSALPNSSVPQATSETEALFVYEAKGTLPESIDLVGEWSGWRPAATLKRVGLSHLYSAKVAFPSDSWVIYKYIVDGEWHLDGLNSAHISAGGGAVNSLFQMPNFRIPPSMAISGDFQRGEDIDLGILPGGDFKGGRRVRIHLPPSYSENNGPYGLLCVLDGEENTSRGRIPEALDWLASQGRPPLIAVFLDHPGAERHLDYTPFFEGSRLQGFADFLKAVVIPTVEARFATTQRREGRGIWGQSFGGTAAFALGHLLPDMFGAVAGQSGVYQWEDGCENLLDWYRKAIPMGTRFYLDSTHFGMEPKQSGAMAKILMDAKVPHIYWERGTHHGYEGWRFWLDDLLSFLDLAP